ncbi:hypothetical protein JB92DRAFT_2909404, partial [Gautieria morchelliformis]
MWRVSTISETACWASPPCLFHTSAVSPVQNPSCSFTPASLPVPHSLFFRLVASFNRALY